MADGDINAIRDLLTDLHFARITEKVPVLVSLRMDSGAYNIATNLSGQTEPAWCGPGPGKKWVLTGLHVNIQDNAQFSALKYGGMTGLTSGIWMAKTSGSNASIVTGIAQSDESLRILHNGDIAKYADTYRYTSFLTDDDMILAEFHFPAMWESEFVLDGNNVERLAIFFNDDFSGLVEHQWVAHGYEVDIR